MAPDSLLFAYFSPETLLPLTSVIASIVGVFMVFGRTLFRIARGLLRVAFGSRRTRTPVLPKPHFAGRTRTPDHASESQSS